MGQLLGLYLPLAGFLVALYYYDRARQRAVVSTLRFWPRKPAPAVRRRHKTIQQPLSLLLQLLALLLLLLAIADPRPDGLGGTARAARDRPGYFRRDGRLLRQRGIADGAG